VETKKSRILRSLLYTDAVLVTGMLLVMVLMVLANFRTLTGMLSASTLYILAGIACIGALSLTACVFRRLHAMHAVAAVGLLLLYLVTQNFAYALRSQPLLLAMLVLNPVAVFVLSAFIDREEKRVP
jgi:hypothetical protein